MKIIRKRKAWKKRLSAAVLTAALILTMLGTDVLSIKAGAAMTFTNPQIVENPVMTAEQKVTWDCVWFGSYPQAEVITTEMSENYTAVYSAYFSAEKDVIVSDSIYSALADEANESQWDSNNDIILDGVKYRRMTKMDATCSNSGSAFYNWSDSVTYHYFKYEPIKWRVLSAESGKAFLLADVVLDGQLYYPQGGTPMSWDRSTLRSWLNGYNTVVGDDDYDYGNDYTDQNFIGSAFTPAEQSAIVSTRVVNSGNLNNGTTDGNDTVDKIFLLSESEVYNTDKAVSYGFLKDSNTCDEARCCKSSTYAKAMGIISAASAQGYTGNCYWWLRSPGIGADDAACVCDNGAVSCDGYSSIDNYDGVRPALNLNLLASDLYYYAGTVCSDGTVVDASTVVDNLIAKIGDVTLESKDAIETAREVYNALTVEQKGEITGLAELTAAEAKLAFLRQEAANVQAKIDALPTTITLANESAVIAARAAYNALTAEQKEQINLTNLTAAETKLAALKQASVLQSGSSQTVVSQSSSPQAKPVVKLNASKVPLQVKKTTTAVKVSAIGKGDKVASWKSSNKKVATVTSKGKIKALKAGKAKITVTTKKGAKATCTVTVQKAKVTTKSLKVSTGVRLTLKKGKKATITVTRNPITATEKIAYQSSNTKIATVTKKGVVKAKQKKGSCKITVKSSNGKKKVIRVTVK